MMIRRLYLVLVVVALQNLATAQASPVELFNEGNVLYTAAEKADGEERTRLFSEAEAAYRAAIEQGSSWTLHYNLGNALFQQERFGEAVLHYRKAMAIAPGESVAPANLLRARSAAGLPQPRTNRLIDITTQITLKTWAFVAVGALWIAAFSGILPLLYKGHSALTLTMTLAMLGLAGIGVAGMYGWHRDAGTEVVLKDAAPLRSAPSAEATARRNLPEALLVRSERQHEEWVYVITEQGDRGWVLRNELGRVWQ